MANAFDIDKVLKNGVDQNVDTHLLNETFHVFSKSPASNVTTLGGARLKSGHTTTASDVWADEIPAFFSAANQAKFDLFSTLAVKDDLCIFGGKVYQHNGTQFVSLGTEAEVLVDGATFQKNNKDVIKYHKNRTAINLTADNNNGDGSNNLSAKIYDAATGSTNFVSQFISSTDKMVAGVPSLAYDATVVAGGVKLAEGLTNDNDYICNAYAGVIQFNKARSSGVTVSAWEYIGDKLTTSISGLRQSIKDISDVTLKGVVASVTADANTAQKAGITVDNTITTTPVIKLTTGSVTTGETKLVTGDAVNTAIKNAIDAIPEVQAATTEVAGVVTISDNDAIATTETSTAAATVAAVAATRSAIAGELGALAVTVTSNKTEVDGKISAIEGKLASTGEIGQAIANVKATADSAVQSVTRATGSSTLLTVTDGTDVTISLSTEVATKSDAATAAANAVTTGLATGGNIAQAIATAKSGAEQTAATALSTARGEITTEISTAVSGLETKLTTGDGSLGAKVAALETATGTTLPAAIQQALTDAKAYSDSLHTTSLDYVVLGDSESLPTASADTLGKIYLVASQNAPTADGSAISGSYVEYMTRKVSETEYTWEKIGTTAADLSAYAKTADLNATNVGTGAVKVTQTDGKVSSVTVATEALVSNGAIKTSVADANALVKAGDALAAIKLAKPASYIKSVNAEKSTGYSNSNSSGEVNLKFTHFGGWDGTEMFWNRETNSIGPSYYYAGKLPSFNIQPVAVINNTIIYEDNSSAENGFIYGSFVASDAYSSADKDRFINTNKIVYLGQNSIFANNQHLKVFKSNLDNVVSATQAFYGTSLSEFIVDMPSLETAESMFDCFEDNYTPTLKTFIGDLSNLKFANNMFKDQKCLTTFIGDLSSLLSASNMFKGCSLDTDSVECIADTINDDGVSIDIGIANETPNNREIIAFNTIHSKGWDVYVNGSMYTPTEPSAITTTDENGEVRTTPIPFYAKAVEVSEEENAEYVDNAGKFYRVLGGQYIYVNDPETYGMFTCLEDAVANMRLTKYVKPEVEA